MKIIGYILIALILCIIWIKPNFDIVDNSRGESWLIMWYSLAPWDTTRKYIIICQIDNTR